MITKTILNIFNIDVFPKYFWIHQWKILSFKLFLFKTNWLEKQKTKQNKKTPQKTTGSFFLPIFSYLFLKYRCSCLPHFGGSFVKWCHGTKALDTSEFWKNVLPEYSL
jgi:hypothetical protein